LGQCARKLKSQASINEEYGGPCGVDGSKGNVSGYEIVMSRTKLKFIGVALFLLMAAVVQAEQPVVSEPHAVVESMTEDLIISLDLYREVSKENPDAFFDDLEGRLLVVIDFDWIAANVMGPYRKKASPEQIDRFAKVFRRGLIETYGRGLLSYSDERIEVVPSTEDVGKKRSVKVLQNIYGAEEVYPVSYSMGLNKNQQWKVINVVINGINLGKTFRNQFIQSAKKHDGNIDLVIENWAASV
jgi:phospholipid transport system substrate-binding protein